MNIISSLFNFIADKLTSILSRLTFLESRYVTRLALTRDNVPIPVDSYFPWFTAYVDYPGYKAIGVVGTRVYDASQSGTLFSWCGFDFCRITQDAQGKDQVDFLIRNHNRTTAAKIRYEIYVLYEKKLT